MPERDSFNSAADLAKLISIFKLTLIRSFTSIKGQECVQLTAE